MKAKVYLSDEGYGHIVRQSAIIESVHRISGDRDTIDFTVQTDRHYDVARRLIKAQNFIKRYNNISWFKNHDGSPDLPAIEKHLSRYSEVQKQYIEKEIKEFKYDFVITDFTYEAIKVAQYFNKPSFGVAHFTWDWFFSKLYPPVAPKKLIRDFIHIAEKADLLFFPPFTPLEIVNHFKNNAKSVPFIVRKEQYNLLSKLPSQDKFNVLIIDSGSRLLSKSIKKALQKAALLEDVHFYLMEGYDIHGKNIFYISQGELLIDYIGSVDLVIGRAGFNTISECIAYKTPMLLLSEARNPEMQENIIALKQEGIGTFMSLSDFENNLSYFLPKFMDTEYHLIKQNMESYQAAINGADIIAEEILNRI